MSVYQPPHAGFFKDPVWNFSFFVFFQGLQLATISSPATLHSSQSTEVNKPISFGRCRSQLASTADTLLFIYLFILQKCGAISHCVRAPETPYPSVLQRVHTILPWNKMLLFFKQNYANWADISCFFFPIWSSSCSSPFHATFRKISPQLPYLCLACFLFLWQWSPLLFHRLRHR